MRCTMHFSFASSFYALWLTTKLARAGLRTVSVIGNTNEPGFTKPTGQCKTLCNSIWPFAPTCVIIFSLSVSRLCPVDYKFAFDSGSKCCSEKGSGFSFLSTDESDCVGPWTECSEDPTAKCRDYSKRIP